jgi:hypothetical protein
MNLQQVSILNVAEEARCTAEIYTEHSREFGCDRGVELKRVCSIEISTAEPRGLDSRLMYCIPLAYREKK